MRGCKQDICMMTSSDYKYQNALRQAIVFSIFFSFLKNRSCVIQICITKIAAKCILVVVVTWRHHANALFVNFVHEKRSKEFCCGSKIRWYSVVWNTTSVDVTQVHRFWRATGQSNLADRMEYCSTGQSAVVWVRKPNFGSFCCCQPFVCQVWLSSDPPELFAFSYCAWLSNWLINDSPGSSYSCV